MSRFTFAPLDPERDVHLLHHWVTAPRARFWMMQDATLDDVRSEYERIDADPHHHAWIGCDRGRPAFLVETYDPAHRVLAGLPELRPGDLGMHLLVAPPEVEPEAGFTTEVFRAVLAHCFVDPPVRRVVVEPDVRNQLIRDKNVASGFVEIREIALDGKHAMLSACTREAYMATEFTAHLTPAAMERAQRHVVAKAIAEFSHERMIAPVAVHDTSDAWELTTPGARYTFRARRHLPEHWVIDEASLERSVDSSPAPLDAQELIAELADDLGIPDDLLPVYLEEIASTLASAAWKVTSNRRPVAELVDAVSSDAEPAEGYQLIEASMTEGHPAFVANNGRIGFGIDDYLAYAPETGGPIQLEWIAARRQHTRLSLGSGQHEGDLYSGQLGVDVVDRFYRRIEGLGEDPGDYLLVPVHPWQWTNKLSITFAPDLARRDLIHLGTGECRYQPQQSIRTFFDLDHPERHYVKTALSIQNMGFMRGLSPEYMRATPAINDWVADTVRTDPVLQKLRFDVLKEVASVGYTGDAYHRLARPSAHQKMIAGLWRESPMSYISGPERLATMASLLHRDADGEAFITALIKSSPVDAATWVETYLRAYLRPLVHALFAHDLVFMPHGENVLLVLRDGVPERVIVKDVGEEVAVLSDRPLPDEIERIRTVTPPETAALAIQMDVLDGVLRYIAAILDDDGMLVGDQFWAAARSVIVDHIAEHPELSEAASRYDLLRARYRHSCLNRLQLRNTREMVDLAAQPDSLQFAGTMANPLSL